MSRTFIDTCIRAAETLQSWIGGWLLSTIEVFSSQSPALVPVFALTGQKPTPAPLVNRLRVN